MLDPGAYNFTYFIYVPHPNIESIGIDVCQSVRFADKPPAYFNLNVQIKQCGRFLLTLPSNNRKPNQAVGSVAQIRAQQVALKLRELMQYGMRICIKFL